MNYKRYLTLFLIILFAIVLRVLFLDKPSGLWNDEYVSYMISKISFTNGFFEAVKSQCHMPFYYLYLKIFMLIFGDSDFVLRLTSVFAGVLSVIMMFFVGKEYRDEKTGMFCAFFTAISSFLIYYSQEVRFYSLLFLLSSILLFFDLRFLKKFDLKSVLGLILTSFLIMFTHTIGFVFIFFNTIFLNVFALKINKGNKIILIKLSFGILISFLILLPLILNVFMTKTFSQWWNNFSFAQIGFIFTDYFSPILTNLNSAPRNFFYDLSLKFILFAILPVIIAFVGIINALLQKKWEFYFLSLTVFLTLIVLIFASVFGKMVLLTKYSTEIYPILILLVVVGLLSLKKRGLKALLISTIIFLNLFYLGISTKAAYKIQRYDGHKIPMILLKNAEIKKNDFILFEYYDKDRFEKYLDFSDYNVISLNKHNFNEYLSKNASYEEIFSNGKEIYKPIFIKKENKYFSDKLNEEIFSKMKKGDKLSVVILNSVAFYSPVVMQKTVLEEEYYSKTPIMFLIFSYIKNQTMNECLQKLSIQRYETKGAWAVVTFVKN